MLTEAEQIELFTDATIALGGMVEDPLERRAFWIWAEELFALGAQASTAQEGTAKILRELREVCSCAPREVRILALFGRRVLRT